MAKNSSRHGDDEPEELDYEVVEDKPKPRRKKRVEQPKDQNQLPDDGPDEP